MNYETRKTIQNAVENWRNAKHHHIFHEGGHILRVDVYDGITHYRLINDPDDYGVIYESKMDGDSLMTRLWGVCPNRTLLPSLQHDWYREGTKKEWRGLIKPLLHNE